MVLRSYRLFFNECISLHTIFLIIAKRGCREAATSRSGGWKCARKLIMDDPKKHIFPPHRQENNQNGLQILHKLGIYGVLTALLGF